MTSSRSWARASPIDALRHSAPAAVVVRQLGRLRADLLPAERRAALLLLVHRRVHREPVPLAHEGRAGALRPDDHRLQSGGHVRGRSHQARAAGLPGRVLGHRRVQHPQGVRLVEGLGRDREPDESGARSHPRLRRRSRAGRDPAQRHRHAVREDGRRAGVSDADEGAAQAPSEDDDHLGAHRLRPRRPSGARVGGSGRARSRATSASSKRW